MRHKTIVTLAYTRDPRFTFTTEVSCVDDAREAYRVAFARLHDQIVRGEKPGPYSAWRLDKVEFASGGRVVSLASTPSCR